MAPTISFSSASRFLKKALPLFLLLRIGGVQAQKPIVHEEGYRTYITRPEFRAPTFKVETYEPDELAEGYWFVAPYPGLGREKQSWSWPVCPFGAHIMDGNGELVWSGACDYDNRNVFDFKVSRFQDKDYISMTVLVGPAGNEGAGAGLILNNNYEAVRQVQITDNPGEFNNHEFHVINNGKTALAITSERKVVDTPELGIQGESRVEFNGFLEIDVETSKVLFNWTSEGHLPFDECTETWLGEATPHGAGWDYVHMNAVDKFKNGDYLISCRHTDTIYRIDGKSGDIKWRMGGNPRQTRGEFRLEGFTFSRQHNARIREEDPDKGTFIMSFLDNAAGNDPRAIPPTNDHSTGYIVHVDEKKKSVTRLNEYPRPDGRISYAKGNVQYLENGNIFVGWAEQGLMSEHSREGKLLQTASFPLFSTYRAYKYPWKGYPTEIPVMKAFAYGTSSTDLNTIAHVSWNGATGAKSYNFYVVKDGVDVDGNKEKANGNGKGSFVVRDPAANITMGTEAARDAAKDGLIHIGNAHKQGFETVFMYSGYITNIVAEALDKDGKPLPGGRTDVTLVEIPDWKAAGFEDSSLPEPDANPGVGHIAGEGASTGSGIGNTTGGNGPDQEGGQGASSGENFVIFLGVLIICGGMIAGGVWFVRHRKALADGKGQDTVNRQRYAAVPDDVEVEELYRREDDDVEKGADIDDGVVMETLDGGSGGPSRTPSRSPMR